jgi:hypothetical protein
LARGSQNRATWTIEVIDTSTQKLYTVPSVQNWSDVGASRILGQVQSQRKGELNMGGDVIKGGEPKAKKKGKKKAAPKKAAKKKAAKK